MDKKNYEQKPLTRNDYIVVEESPNEALVYDSTRNKLHVLTPIATAVWKNCDGKTSVSEIAHKLKAELNNELGEEVAWMALDELGKNGLLEHTVKIPRDNVSRRDVIKTLAISLPLVTTLIAPSPTRAQTGGMGMMMMMMMDAMG